jgi:DNA-binding CsgD family transcriptional regulator
VGVPEEAAAGGTRGWPLGGESQRWPVIERSLVHWLHGSSPAGWRVAHAHESDEVRVLVAGEPAAVYAVHASREPGLGGFADDELRSWAKAAVLLRQVVCQRVHSRPGTTMAERVEHAAAKLNARATRLSVREQQVVARIACGMTNDGIAADLCVAPSTVLTLRRRAYAKLDINSCVELSWLAQ